MRRRQLLALASLPAMTTARNSAGQEAWTAATEYPAGASVLARYRAG